MKLAFKRKHNFILICIAFFSALGCFFYYSFIIPRKTNYIEIKEHCKESESLITNCEVFISNRFENELGQDCLSIILPVPEEDQRETELCFSMNLLNWSNPYPSYDLLVPVEMSARFSKNLLYGDKVKSVDLRIIDEDRINKITNPINSNTTKPILFWTKLVLENNDRGYYLTKRLGNELINEDTFKTYDVLGVKEVEINNLTLLESGNSYLDLSLILEGKLFQESIEVTPFKLVSNNMSDSNRFEEMVVDGKNDLEEIFFIGEKYQMQFTVKEHEKIDEELINQYITLENDLELVLKYVIVENEN